ncbi:hypothetical protein [Geodermatophilus sp. DSM 44513]|uniref:hypothetical protein n=1 Tax=Geodermatophilus sp. DSM 44513 TaxID=1528104 RepID=UPI00128397ED|nr:hypothetical protein [Geodermatophilus sp. DSM 44513]WNV76022.1 hypothetical protein RTG05_01805 [Geodermatophilus sp. DSM 44513]
MAMGFRDVVDWVDGGLDDQRAARVAAAVAADPELQAAAAWYRSFRAASARMTLESPPQQVHDALLHRFAALHPPAPGFLERVRAVISFDSATAQLALGVRAADTGVGRHVVVESATVDVALDLYPEDRDVRVEGQLLPADPEAPARGTVRLLRDGAELAAADADDTGRFALPPVPAGAALLVAEVAGTAIEVDVSLVT